MAPRGVPLGAAAIALSVVLVAGGIRLVREGRSELTASDAAWEKGDPYAAAVHARGAARAYVPGAEHMQDGYARLRSIAEGSERKGDVEAALFAWRAVLSAADSSRPFGGATPEARARAEASVARLSAALVTPGRGPSRRPPTADTTTGGGATSRVGWGVLLLGGAGLWCGAGAWLARRGWGNDGRLARSELRTAAGMALAGLVAWVAGLLLG